MNESSSSSPDAMQTALDALFQPYNLSDKPGLVVGIRQHGKTLYRRGFGLASIEHGVANTAWTRMRIGSTSKHFTCLAALLLAEEGKLDIDAGVRRYLPELPALAAEPTLRQLMNHTGGQRCYLDIGFLADGMAIKPVGAGLEALVRQGEVNFAPGEKFIYNNGGYHLLSLIIERVGGMPFERFISERILTPLGMLDSLSVPSDFEIHRGMATLHVAQPDGGYKRGIFPSMEVRGEGAIISTLDDMLRWLAHLRGPKQVGSDASWAQMLTPATLSNGVSVPYALGLMRHDYRGVEVIHHAGGVIGGSCQMLTVPTHALDIVIMSNGAAANPHELAKQVIDALLADVLLAPSNPKAQSKHYQPLLGRRYSARSSGFVLGFEDVEGDFGVTLLDLPAAPLRSRDGRLSLNFEDIAAGPFVADVAQLAADGVAPATLQIGESGVPEIFDLLAQTPPLLADAGPALEGRYASPDLAATACITFDGDTLTMTVTGAFGGTAMTLQPFGDDIFGWRMAAVEMPLRGILRVQREEGKVVALRIDTMRTRHMRFDRLAGAVAN